MNYGRSQGIVLRFWGTKNNVSSKNVNLNAKEYHFNKLLAQHMDCARLEADPHNCSFGIISLIDDHEIGHYETNYRVFYLIWC